MRFIIALLGVVAVSAVYALIQVEFLRPSGARRDPAAPAGPPRRPTPVALNRGPEVPDGFRGEVHPLLFGPTRLEVTARWTTVGKGRDQMHRYLNLELYSWFTTLRPARPRQTYTERDFSAFLPVRVGEGGQLWSLDPDKMVRILTQFHRRSSRTDSACRRVRA